MSLVSFGDRHMFGGKKPTVQMGGSSTVNEKSPLAQPSGWLKWPAVSLIATDGGSKTSSCSTEGWYVTPICPMVVRLASNTGSVGLICSKSRDASSAAPGPFCSNVRTLESSVASTSEIPARLRAQVRTESAVFACESSSGPVSSVRVRVRSTTLFESAEIRDVESDNDPRSYPAPLKASNDSSSNWPILFLGR